MSNLLVQNIKHTNATTAQTIDSTGRILTPARPSFRAYNTTSGWVTVTHNEFQIMPFNAEVYDIGGDYNTSTYRFTCPVNGIYWFGLRAYMHSDGGTLRLTIIKGTTNPATDESTFLAQDYRSANVSQRNGTLECSCSVQLTANTQVGAYIRHDTDTNNSFYTENNVLFSSFQGYLIG
jgi:hypothetical protein